MAPDAIFGREQELASIERFLLEEPHGLRVLVLEGEAGIGKSTLWAEAVRMAAARDRVLRARAAEAEAKLSFTVLTDLLELVVGEIVEALPSPQRWALEAALMLQGPSSRARPDARAVSMATSGAFRSLASNGPITVAIDDVQWTDAPSARALAFALRRLTDRSITVIAARRTAPGLRDPLDLPSLAADVQRLPLGPLDEVSFTATLRRHAPRKIPKPLALRIHASSSGNPLFGLELARALGGTKSGSAMEPLPVPDDLSALLRDRLATLPEAARQVLLVVAASASPTVDLIASIFGSDQALDDAVRAGIAAIRGGSIDFAHPLFASTLYANASTSSRRDAHRRLAEVSTDPEERARHLALSSSGSDVQVAAALDRAAVHARARGAPQAAAELFELALAATDEQDVRARAEREKALAGNLFDAGDPPRAREILEGAVARLGPGPPRAEALCLLSEFSWKDLDRVAELLHQALDEVGQDRRRRAWFEADLAWVELDSCRLVEAEARAGTAAELAGNPGGDDPYALRLSLSTLALSRFLLGRPAGELFERATSLQSALAPADLSSPATCLGRVRTWEGDLAGARKVLGDELDRYRENGHETSCYEILAHLAEAEYRAGQLAGAARHAAEAIDISIEAGVDVLGEILPVKAFVECVGGDVEGARRDAIDGLSVCERTGDRWNEIRCREALGLVELSLGDPAAAHRWLEPLPGLTGSMGLEEPGVFPFIPDEVEALVALGELEPAKALTERLEEQGRMRDRLLAIGTAARCRALIDSALGDLPGAAGELERSIELLELSGHPFELARSLLVGGEVERRMKKKRSARELLDRAAAVFDELGASPWGEMTRRELARIGGRSASVTELTPTETQVARLVAEGRTNREVAEALFISVNTVEANLKRIYRKLQVRSRTELARRF